MNAIHFIIFLYIIIFFSFFQTWKKNLSEDIFVAHRLSETRGLFFSLQNWGLLR